MRSKQTGVTMLGWIFLLIPMALVVYSAIRLFPIYMNYMSVARSLELVKNEMKDNSALDVSTLQTAVTKHLMVEGVEFPSAKDIKYTRQGHAWVISAVYDDQTPIFSNIYYLVSFNKSVTLGGGGGGF